MTQESANRVPELDGIRGLAILMVMAYHIFPLASILTTNTLVNLLNDVATIGWLGVDIFFVLSGFLITSILLNTRDSPHYFKNFYARRILRIFPLYWLIIGGIFLILPILTPKTASIQQASWPYFALYLQNWLLIPSLHLGRYSRYVGPSWSLAIEEQFYLIWPSLVFFLSRNKMVFLSTAIVIISPAIRFFLVQFAGNAPLLPHFLYFSSFTRFDGLSIGALIAIASQSQRWKQIFSRFAWPVLITSLACLILIVIVSGSILPTQKNDYLNIWGYSLIALAAGALLMVITTSPKDTILPSFFRNRILIFFGKYSYCIYLIHFPVALFILDHTQHININSMKAWLIFVSSVFGLTIIGSLLTWHLLEKQMLKLKKHFEYQVAEI